MNELLSIIELIAVFGGVLLTRKFFGKKGLFAWVAIAGILANLQVNKTITLFGLDVAMGNVMFASSFLATDMLSEIYGKKVAKKAVVAGVSALVFFICFMQLTLAFTPSQFDIISPAMSEFFQMSVRTTVASVAMYALANVCDVYLFDFLKKKTGGKFPCGDEAEAKKEIAKLYRFALSKGFSYSVTECAIQRIKEEEVYSEKYTLFLEVRSRTIRRKP